MNVNYLHLMCVLVFMAYSFRMGLKTAVVNFIYIAPFYSISLIDLPWSAYIKPPEVYAAGLAVLFIAKRGSLKSAPLIFALLFFIPFLISLVLNVYHFNPIDAWEIDAEKREVFYEKLTTRREITSTNFTQLLYIIAALVVFVVSASVDMASKREHIGAALGKSAALISIIGLFQIVAYYYNFYGVYLWMFYNSAASNFSELAWNEIGGIKRINSTFSEPSIFGLYIGLYMLVALILGGWRVDYLLKRPSFWVALFAGMISLSGTFYFCLFTLAGFYLAHKYRGMTGIALCLCCILVVVAAASWLPSLFLFEPSTFFDQKKASFIERYYFGLELPLKNISINPFWGAALGSDRPTTLIFNLLVSVGFVGFFIAIVAVSFIWRRGVKDIIYFWMLCGMLSPDLNFIFIWLYIGIVYSALSGAGIGVESVRNVSARIKTSAR
ncbi:hypothetical protein RM530_03160 [Algiphilus sp. W345]|uniref:Uncharacterized protein n=1 Tax=Banduia mediterranea TaxID=3075609 RepID=A0ABU2WES4_9GAMM|nr:hypothetical protein [Algiphilus sp. W345]MDT0496367.1 hypothetical protein [Algiphilus sp. W345]